MRKLISIITCTAIMSSLQAQHEPIQPFESLGIKVKVLTLTKGKYQEFIPNDTILRIGSVLFDRVKGVVVKVLERDTSLGEYEFRPGIPSRWISPEPLVDEHTNISPYNYALNNPIRYIDPDGLSAEDIIIRGTKDDNGDRFRLATFDALQSLTNDKLQLNKDGSITIVERGTGGLAHGTELIRGLVEGKTAAGKDFDVVISNDARGVTINDDEPLNLKTNALTKPVYGPNASNGKGTGSNVYIGLELNSNLLMLDGTREKIPYNIAVGHELIHADNNRVGNRSIKRIEGLPTIKNSEELKSIQRENILRSEQGNKLRYDGSMFIKK